MDSLFELGNLDTFPVRGQRPAGGGNTYNRANSAQFQLKLPTGTDFGKKYNWCKYYPMYDGRLEIYINLNNSNSNFRLRRWRSLLTGCTCLTGPLIPSSTGTEMFWLTCLQSHLQTSPPTPQNSYPNPRTTFENTPIVNPKIA